MADGYARITGKPALTLLHLGTGFSNGIANLHNARRAKSPVVNVVGDHATYHKRWDSPLKSDVEAIARPVSDWLRMAASAHTVSADGAAAIAAARAATAGEFDDRLAAAMRQRGPMLIEAVMPSV